MEPEKYGKYQILAKIGQGGMGEVYRARDPVLKRDVAIKTISANLGGDDELRQRFEREAQLAANLNHPNIIAIYDFGEERGKIYMAMELLIGSDLKDAMRGDSLSSLDRKLELVEEICVGLGFAHARGIIHRDLKPANIHIQPDGRVKIMDFGLARLQSSDMTRTGMMMGTPDYMAPEQIQGGKADARSDIYSMGALLYELLSKQRPFKAENTHGLLFQVLYKEPEPVGNLVPELPESVRLIVSRALSKDPNQRFQNGDEMRNAVRGARHALVAGEEAEAALVAALSATDPGATMIEMSPLPTPKPSIPPRRSGGPATGQAEVFSGVAVATPRPATAAPTRATARPASGAPRTPSRPSQGSVMSGGMTASGQTIIVKEGSRVPLYIVSGIAVAALALIVLYMGGFIPGMRGGGEGGAGSANAAAARAQLHDSWVQRAQDLLSRRDFAAAIEQAEKVLAEDAGNAAARSVVDSARDTLGDLEKKATEAERAFASGDTEQASKILADMMAIHPGYPAVKDLSVKLNRFFKDRAETARKTMIASRNKAERAGATDLKTFSEAVQSAGKAGALFDGGDYAMAAMSFSTATMAFERSLGEAEDRHRQVAMRQEEARIQETRKLQELQKAQKPPASPPAGTDTGALAKPTTPAGRSTDSNGAASGPVQSPVQQPPPAGTNPIQQVPLPEPVPVDEGPEIRKVLRQYAKAIESKDLALFKSLKPNLSEEDERNLARAFKSIKEQQVNLTIEEIEVDAKSATVRVTRKDTIDGKPATAIRQVFTLSKQRGEWKILDIGIDN